MLYKNIKLLLLLGLLAFSVSPIHAEDDLEYVPLDVTVPTEASIKFNEDGSNIVPSNFTIINNSDIGGIKITGIEMVSENDWKLKPLGFDQTKFPVDSKQVKMQLSTEHSQTYDLSTIDKLTIQDMPIDVLSSLNMNFIIWRAAYSIEGTEKAFNMITTIDWIKEPAIIKFDSDGGSAVDKIITIKDGLDLYKYQPTKHEHVFQGWYDAKDPLQTILNNDLPLNGNINLKAKWLINQYTTTFDSQGGSIVDLILQDWSSSIDLDAINPTRTGYTFIGWYIDDQRVNGSFVVEKDTTLTAKWDANSYVLKFDSQGGTSQSDLSVTYNQNATLPSPTRKGYTFNGWYTGPNATGNKVADGVYQTASDQQLYASWTINQYTMTFNSNGGSAISSVKQNFNTVINLNSYTPSKTGYTFIGWYIGGTKYSGNYTLTDDVTLVAKWTANSYTIAFDSQGGTSQSAMTATYDQSFNLPSPTKYGYTFVGWYTGPNATGSRVSSGTYRYASNITLYAYWQANTYTLNFDSNGGSWVSAKAVTYGSQLGWLGSPSRAGYYFDGWTIGGSWVSSSTTYPWGYDVTAVANWSNQAPVITYLPNISISYDAYTDAGSKPDWMFINLNISDREDGTLASYGGYDDISYTGTGNGLFNRLFVCYMVASNGNTYGDGTNNAWNSGDIIRWVKDNGRGTYTYYYATTDSLGLRSSTASRSVSIY